jgi:hypothetical protein
MDALTLERRLTTAIAVLTAVTGFSQVVAAQPMLAIIATAPPDAADGHLFSTVGMFMVVVAGALLHALHRPHALHMVLLWSVAQKLLAAAFVAWGISRGVFQPLAWIVAVFDFGSGLLFLDLRRRLG